MPRTATATEATISTHSTPCERPGASPPPSGRTTGASQWCSQFRSFPNVIPDGIPIHPAVTAPTASSSSGTVITRGDSCACARASAVPRNSPQKTSVSSRHM
ncbi:MAG: hypothetical protein BWX64_02759 [Acidobacteria bacterium ADurb.Bin051]|nr:MAG: hypothetical protein BWX64_02759 [Acidobacteria bacterium ADurb.Bin051]